jgi:hypothetical protein
MTGDPVFTESQAFDTLGLQPGEEQAKIDQHERQAYATNYLGGVAGDDPTYSPVRCDWFWDSMQQRAQTQDGLWISCSLKRLLVVSCFCKPRLTFLLCLPVTRPMQA